MRRGQIWTSAGGAPYSQKPRPVLIVQADVYEGTASIAICGITTDSTPTPFTRPQLRPSVQNGLRQPSRVMVDKITTVPRERLRDLVGHVTEGDMLAVASALALFLDIPP